MKYLIVPLKAPPLCNIKFSLSSQRAALGSNVTKVTLESFLKWKERKVSSICFPYEYMFCCYEADLGSCSSVKVKSSNVSKPWGVSLNGAGPIFVLCLKAGHGGLIFFFFFLITGRCRKVLLVRVKTTVQYVLANQSAHKTIKVILQFCGLLQL